MRERIFFIWIFENMGGVGGSATPGCSAERLENLEKYPRRHTLTASPPKTAEKVAYNRHYVQQFPKNPIQDHSINFTDKKYRFRVLGRIIKYYIFEFIDNRRIYCIVFRISVIFKKLFRISVIVKIDKSD